MSISAAPQEELLRLRSEGWSLKPLNQEEVNTNSRQVKASLIYRGGFGDIAERRTLYALGCIPVFAGSLACGALCCLCSLQSSQVQSGHVRVNRQNPRRIEIEYHDDETAQGLGEIGDVARNSVLESFEWNGRFLNHMAPFQSKTYVREVVANESELNTIFSEDQAEALLRVV